MNAWLDLNGIDDVEERQELFDVVTRLDRVAHKPAAKGT